MICVFYIFLRRTLRNLDSTESLNFKCLGKANNHTKSIMCYAKLTRTNLGDVSA